MATSTHSALTARGTVPSREKSTPLTAVALHTITMDEKRQDHEYNMEEITADRKWKSCCFTVEKDSTMHFSKLFITLILIAFSCYMLVTEKDCSAQHMFYGTIGILIGHWFR